VRESAKRMPSDHRRKVSISDIASVSPAKTSQSPSAPAPPPKRRSTMNSRDAAYEEQVKAAMEASKREAMIPTGQEESEVGGEGEREVVDEEEELEAAQGRRGKRKRENDESGECSFVFGFGDC